MRYSVLYIFSAFCLLLISCTREEINPDGHGANYVMFTARQTAFMSYNSSKQQTKALDETELTALERDIYTAYCLVFDSNGNRVSIENVLNGQALSTKILHSDLGGDVTVCFIANVPYSYANSLTTTTLVSTTPLPITYATYENIGYLGVPYLTLDTNGDGTDDTKKHCLPMFGMVSCSLEDYADGAVVPVEIKRLFAKIVVNISVDVDIVLNSAPNTCLWLESYALYNLPQQIILNEENLGISSNTYIEENNVNFETTVKIYDADNEGAASSQKTFQISAYVPEYIALNDKTINLSLAGSLYKDNGATVNVIYQIPLGGDPYNETTPDFNILRNKLYRNNFKIIGTDHLIDSNDQVEVLPLNLVDTYSEASNCYILSEPSTYVLDAYEGVVKNITPATTKLEGKPYLVYNDGKNQIDLFNADIQSTSITFNIPNAVVPGNAIIAIKGDNPATEAIEDEILWSWHLWFCTDRPDDSANLERYPDDAGGFNGMYVMNRALGAINSTGFDLSALGGDNYSLWKDGAYYQWGRKDPLALSGTISSENITTGGTYAMTKANPTKFYTDWSGTDAGAGWTAAKSVNDPCPPGYKVPTSTVWRSSNPDASYTLFGSKLTTSERYSYNLTREVSETTPSMFIFYPYAGNYDINGTRITSVQSTQEATTDESYVIDYAIPTAQESLFPQVFTPKQFRNITFNYNIGVNHGAYWSNDKRILLFGYSYVSTTDDSIFGSFNGDHIISCQYQTGSANYRTEKRQTGTFFGKPIYTTYYIYDGTVKWNNNWTTITDLSSSNWLAEKPSINEGLNKYLNDMGLMSDAYDYRISDSEPANGHQIRCVRE